MDDFYIILFHSTNNSMWAAKVLKKDNIERKLIPIPRHLSSDCGYCIRVKSQDISRTKEILDNTKIDYDRIEKL